MENRDDLTELANNFIVALAAQGWSLSVGPEVTVIQPRGSRTALPIPNRIADDLFRNPEVEHVLMAMIAMLSIEAGFVWPYPPDQYGDVHGETPPTA